MNDELDVIARTKEEAHLAARQAYALAQSIIDNGNTVRFRVGEDQDPITIKQRAFLHAAVFPQIAEQYAFPDGTRFTADVWKEFWRKRFLPDKWVMEKTLRWDEKLGCMVVSKRKTPKRVRRSTEDLKGVKAYSDYIDKVIDHAVLELGVRFVFRAGEREAVKYRPPVRAPKTKSKDAEAAPA